MTVSRRRLFQSLALAGVSGADAAEDSIPLDVIRDVSAAHGANLSDDRLRVLKPVLESRRAQLQALRDFPLDDAVAPTQGILDK